MLPGLVSKMSVSTIATSNRISPKTDVVLLIGSNTLVNIIPPFAGFCGFVIFIPVDGDISVSASGNIFPGINVILKEGRANLMVYVPKYPGRTDGVWILAPTGLD